MLLQLQRYQCRSDLEAVIFTQLHVMITESPCRDNSCNGCANRLLILAEYYGSDGSVGKSHHTSENETVECRQMFVKRLTSESSLLVVVGRF